VKSIVFFCAFSVLALGAVACSSDDNGSSGGNADATAYITSCKALCEEQTAASCSAYDTVDECNADCDQSAGATGDCAAKLKAYGACLDAASDPCTAEDACSTQMTAMMAACMQ